MPPSLQSKTQLSNPCRTPWQQKWIGLDVTSPAVQLMADEAEKFAGRFFRNDSDLTVLVLYGVSGTGKSHTAACITRYARQAAFSAWEQGHWKGKVPSVGFYRWPELCKGFEERNYAVVDDTHGMSLVVLDDVGAEKSTSPWHKDDASDKLCQILSRRERKFTLITTNIPPGHWADRFDFRVADRFMRNSKVVDLSNVPSYVFARS
jgi:DNA replication protein DnaC